MLKKLTLLASNSFHYLNVFNQCNIPYDHRHGMSKGKVTCDNFDGEHHAPDFLQLHDKDNIKKSKDNRAAHMGGSGRGGGCGGGRQSDHKKWIKNKYNKDRDRNEYGNGVQKRVNMCMYYCVRQWCGWNTTHTSGFHAA